MIRIIFSRLQRVIKETVDVSKADLTFNTHFEDDLNMSKDDLKLFARKITDEFNIDIPKNFFKEFETIGELVGFIEVEKGR